MKWGTPLAFAFALFLSCSNSAWSQGNIVKNCNDLGVVSFFSKLLQLDDDLFSENSVNAFCNEFDQLVQSVRELRNELEVAKSKLPPPDSILIIDDESGCPDGWTNVALLEPDVFEGRVPIVAAPPGERGEFRYRMIGGVTKRSLGLEQLPSHNHATVVHAGADDPVGWKKLHMDKDDVRKTFEIAINNRVKSPTLVFATRSEGQGISFGIMPPYVPLHFCKLD